jgi:hypothetical protein
LAIFNPFCVVEHMEISQRLDLRKEELAAAKP